MRKLLRLQPDPNDDAVLQTALAAAVDFGVNFYGGVQALDVNGDPLFNPDGSRVYVDIFPANATNVPDSAHQACLMHAARIFRRRDSLDGTIMGGDLTIVRVGNYDPDILALYGTTAPGLSFA